MIKQLYLGLPNEDRVELRTKYAFPITENAEIFDTRVISDGVSVAFLDEFFNVDKMKEEVDGDSIQELFFNYVAFLLLDKPIEQPEKEVADRLENSTTAEFVGSEPQVETSNASKKGKGKKGPGKKSKGVK